MKPRILLAPIFLLVAAFTVRAVEPTPEAIVQKQLEAYNAHDLEAFAATYAVRGIAQLRERYAPAFADATLHAEIVNRMVVGNTVVDHERVRRRFPEGPGTLEAIAIYMVENGKIAKVWFRRGERKLD